eukprot:g25994.t1
MMTLNGLTRALVGVSCGRLMINSIGIDAVWFVTGIVGALGLLVNVICLCQGSVFAAYVLNFTWAVYNGLWNSCLETSWARSIFRSKREDINGARQITNKVTTSLGPLFSAAIFLSYGNHWDVGLVQNVMLFGTGMTSVVVALCFFFRSTQEIEQDLPLQDIQSMEFFCASNSSEASSSIHCKDCFANCPAQAEILTFEPDAMCQTDFMADDDGNVVLTCPRTNLSCSGILTSDYKETHFILAKQFRASLKGVEGQSCLLWFRDAARPCLPVQIEELQIYLKQVGEDLDEVPRVNGARSTIRFSIDPDALHPPQHFSLRRFWRSILLGALAA